MEVRADIRYFDHSADCCKEIDRLVYCKTNKWSFTAQLDGIKLPFEPEMLHILVAVWSSSTTPFHVKAGSKHVVLTGSDCRKITDQWIGYLNNLNQAALVAKLGISEASKELAQELVEKFRKEWIDV